MKYKRFLPAPVLVILLTASSLLAWIDESVASDRQGMAEKAANLSVVISEKKLLEPDTVFKLHVAAKDTRTLIVALIPAKGYYLYKDRIHFSIKSASEVRISSVNLPNGVRIHDPKFGPIDIYRNAIPIELRLSGAIKGKSVSLAASYQGCYERLGVCYSPVEKAITLVLP